MKNNLIRSVVFRHKTGPGFPNSPTSVTITNSLHGDIAACYPFIPWHTLYQSQVTQCSGCCDFDWRGLDRHHHLRLEGKWSKAELNSVSKEEPGGKESLNTTYWGSINKPDRPLKSGDTATPIPSCYSAFWSFYVNRKKSKGSPGERLRKTHPNQWARG